MTACPPHEDSEYLDDETHGAVTEKQRNGIIARATVEHQIVGID